MNDWKNKQLLFGLDIGTRTVVGTVGYMENQKWHTIACLSRAHQDRAMLDGQIHDIQKVSQIVGEVKRTLEQQLGVALKEVAIAAAGRVLVTKMARVDKTFDSLVEIDKAAVQFLEMAGIDQIKKSLETQQHLKKEYFCVAHTVIHYYLDEYMIANLEGHKGEAIGAEILATFLPKGVIDSLYAVTERVGLEVSYLTLEPIAAMNAVIPEQLRLLNLALVDIGAGTSDIAITREGSVVAYGMIPFAGDEMTEAIVHKYLVDFNMAERMKQDLSVKETIPYEDIIGLTASVSKEELLQTIAEPMNRLAEKIAQQILKLNGKKATNAVFCVGGGSQLPGFTEKLAQLLDILPQRVSLRSTQHIQEVTHLCEVPNTPDMITPLGICLTAAKQTDEQFITVKVNEREIQLINTKKLSVLDVLVEAGIDHEQIFPTHGQSLLFKVQNERIRLKGTMGKPSTLLLNNHTTTLETPVYHNDQIMLIKARKGTDAQAVIKDYIDQTLLKTIHIEEDMMQLPLVLVNGDCVALDYAIRQQDNIQVKSIDTVEALCTLLQRDSNDYNIMIDNKEVAQDTLLQDGDKVCFIPKNTLSAAYEVPQEPIEAQIQDEVQPIVVFVNDEKVVLPWQEEDYMFVNIFDYIDFDLTIPKGTIRLELNGQRAAVTDKLQNGDKLQIYWEN